MLRKKPRETVEDWANHFVVGIILIFAVAFAAILGGLLGAGVACVDFPYWG